jgi:hypothetical protein
MAIAINAILTAENLMRAAPEQSSSIADAPKDGLSRSAKTGRLNSGGEL